MFADLHVYWCYRKDRSSRGDGVCSMIRQSSNLVVTRVVMLIWNLLQLILTAVALTCYHLESYWYIDGLTLLL